MQSVDVFIAMMTQWRAGYTGLDYGVLPEIWRRTKTPAKDRDAIFGDLQVMENAALGEIHKG